MVVKEYKRFRYFVKFSYAQEKLEEVVKLRSKKMSQKLKVTLKVLDSVAYKCPDTKIFIDENLQQNI